MKKKMELGRSMVEMLGVLFIIGLLSVVGLLGYRRAMNKIHANELMDLGIKVYNENVARAVIDPTIIGNTNKAYLCSNGLPETVTGNATYVDRCNKSNLGLTPLSWGLPSFTIVTYVGTAYDNIFFGGVGSCDICAKIKEVTEDSGTSSYRLLPGSKDDILPGGVRVYCLKGVAAHTGTAKTDGSGYTMCLFE